MVCTDMNEGVNPAKVGWETGYAGELEDFAKAVIGSRAGAAAHTPAATAADAIADLKLMMAMMLSAKTARWEAVADVDASLDMDSLGLDCTLGGEDAWKPSLKAQPSMHSEFSAIC